MKKAFCFLGCGVFLLFSTIWADNLTVTFTSKDIASGSYSPERDVVVYILSNTGAFVRTAAVWGGDRRDIATWSKISTSVVDATSGATISGSSANLSATWNGNDANKQPVANGTYWLCIDGTASDNNSAAPRLRIKIVFDGTSKTITAADSSLNSGLTYFTNLSVKIIASGSSISVSGIGPVSSHWLLSLSKTIIAVPENANKTVALHLYSLNGAAILQRTIRIGQSESAAMFPLTIPTPGIYLVKITSGLRVIQEKIVIGK